RSVWRPKSTRCRAPTTSPSSRRPTRASTCWAGGGAATDAIFILQSVLSTYNGKGDGDWNCGRYSNPKLDALTQKVKTEMNGEARLVYVQEALMAHNAEINHLPLHRQVIPWASRSNITVVHRADNVVTPYWVKMQ